MLPITVWVSTLSIPLRFFHSELVQDFRHLFLPALLPPVVLLAYFLQVILVV